MAIRWKVSYGGKQAKAHWYLLTNIDSLEKTLKLSESRFGIKAMFKDCKTGGYNIEKTKVSEPRFLALVLLIAIAYSLNTIKGQQLNTLSHPIYICRPKESNRSPERHILDRDLWLFGLCYAMDGGYKRWNPYRERHLAIFVNYF